MQNVNVKHKVYKFAKLFSIPVMLHLKGC